MLWFVHRLMAATTPAHAHNGHFTLLLISAMMIFTQTAHAVDALTFDLSPFNLVITVVFTFTTMRS